jgi:hypothetical protein
VTLRLKFEAKLKEMHSSYRKLEIDSEKDRSLLELNNTQLKRLQTLSLVQSEELIKLREERADNLTKLSALEEFKDLTGKDLKHKV